MKKIKLNDEDRNLIELANNLLKKKDWKYGSVASALKGEDKRIHFGMNIFDKRSGPTSTCAEFSAISTAYTEGNEKIDTITAVRKSDSKLDVITPCGRCRGFMALFGNPWVIISKSHKVRLSNLIPLL